MQEVLVVVAVNGVGEHHARVVDSDDLRDVNESLDWIQESDVYLIVVERAEYKALVYIEAPESLRWEEKDELVFDAESEIARWMRNNQSVRLTS